MFDGSPMTIDKTDIEAASYIFCDLMKIDPEAEHPSGLLNWQVTVDRYREMLALNEGLRIRLANRESDLQGKIQEIAKAVSPASN